MSVRTRTTPTFHQLDLRRRRVGSNVYGWGSANWVFESESKEILVEQLAFLVTDVSYSPSVRTVGVDIKPGSNPNSINLCSKGVVTVAILGSADLDVGSIDQNSLKLGASVLRIVGKGNKSSCNIKDVSGDFSVSPEGMADGYPDLVCQYDTLDLGDFSGQSSATVTGSLFNGQAFTGTDAINIVKDSCIE